MAVAMDPSAGFLEAGKTLQRQRLQGSPFDVGEVLADLLAGGAMQPRVGHGLLPVEQEAVLFVQAGESPALEGVFLDVVDAAFDLALVPGHIGRVGRGPGRNAARRPAPWD